MKNKNSVSQQIDPHVPGNGTCGWSDRWPWLFDAVNFELMQRLLGPSSEKANSMHIATHLNVEKSLRLVKLTTKQILNWTPQLGHYYLIVLSA